MARARGAARDRVIGAAVELFAEHGVQGTSLRMIADRIGVGKAAVYYQFQSKDEIVLAVLRPAFDDLARLIACAESAKSQRSQREAAVIGLVDLLVRQRHASFPFRRDRYIDQLIMLHKEFRTISERLYELLLGSAPDPAARVALTVAIAGVYYCATDPMLSDVSAAQLNDILKTLLRQCVAQH